MGNDSTMSMFASKADFLEAELARYKAMCKRLAGALESGRDALAGGLWDYGPGQDEHEKCESVIAGCDAALSDYKAMKGE